MLVVVSGTVLLLEPEIEQVTHPSLYDTDGGVMGFISNLHTCRSAAKKAPVWSSGGRAGGRWARGFKVRRGRGRYKLNHDLHKVVGFIALPFLLMWAVAGAMFELPDQVNAVWYALTPGSQPAEAPEFVSEKPGKGARTISPGEALAIAQDEVPGGSKLISIIAPDLSNEESTYEYWFSHGVDPYAYSPWPGSYGVAVDRYTGRTHNWMPEQEDRTLTSAFWQDRRHDPLTLAVAMAALTVVVLRVDATA